MGSGSSAVTPQKAFEEVHRLDIGAIHRETLRSGDRLRSSSSSGSGGSGGSSALRRSIASGGGGGESALQHSMASGSRTHGLRASVASPSSSRAQYFFHPRIELAVQEARTVVNPSRLEVSSSRSELGYVRAVGTPSGFDLLQYASSVRVTASSDSKVERPPRIEVVLDIRSSLPPADPTSHDGTFDTASNSPRSASGGAELPSVEQHDAPASGHSDDDAPEAIVAQLVDAMLERVLDSAASGTDAAAAVAARGDTASGTASAASEGEDSAADDE